MTEFRGARVLVTGGTSGLGLETVRRMIAAGAKSVVSVSRRPPKDPDRVPGADYVLADVTDADGLRAALESSPCGVDFDIVVCCAGRALPGLFADVPVAEMADQMRLDYLGSVNAVSIVLPGMLSRGRGHVVLVSSTAGLIGVIGYAGYCAAKWALRGFAETLRYEVEPRGVKVSIVYPPDMDTPGFAVENLRKPAETRAVSGAIKPVSPALVADALLRGVRRNRPHITVDPGTALLVRWANVLEPVLRPMFARTIVKARGRGR